MDRQGLLYPLSLAARGNALANPELTSGRRFLEGKAISFCVESLAHGLQGRAIGTDLIDRQISREWSVELARVHGATPQRLKASVA